MKLYLESIGYLELLNVVPWYMFKKNLNFPRKKFKNIKNYLATWKQNIKHFFLEFNKTNNTNLLLQN